MPPFRLFELAHVTMLKQECDGEAHIKCNLDNYVILGQFFPKSGGPSKAIDIDPKLVSGYDQYRLETVYQGKAQLTHSHTPYFHLFV